MTDLAAIQQLLARERLSIDRCERGRTTFLSHLGAAPRLVPGAWLGHRDLLYALALANLSPAQRQSLARAVLVDHGREFGIGRLALTTCPSGLPLGGSSLLLRRRTGGPSCLYTWALGAMSPAVPSASSQAHGPAATAAISPVPSASPSAPVPGASPSRPAGVSVAAAASSPREPGAPACDWLLLRPQPGWALDAPPPVLRADSLATLHALGLHLDILVATATCARQVADHCLAGLPFSAHPRFAPHLDGDARAHGPDAPIRLTPHDAFDPRTFGQVAKNRSQEPAQARAVILVDAPAELRARVDTWLSGQPAARPGQRPLEIVAASCPGRIDRPGLLRLWQTCGRPHLLVRGDPEWATPAAAWLREQGAAVEAQTDDGTQLGLFG